MTATFFHTIGSRAVGAGLVALIAMGAPAHAQSGSDAIETQSETPAQETARSIGPRVEDLQVVGPWQSENGKGVWRVVLLGAPRDETDQHFFVQQLAEDGDTRNLVNSTEIIEIADIDGSVVGYRADDPGENAAGMTLFVDILPTDGEVSQTYELHIAPDQPYRFGQSSN